MPASCPTNALNREEQTRVLRRGLEGLDIEGTYDITITFDIDHDGRTYYKVSESMTAPGILMDLTRNYVEGLIFNTAVSSFMNCEADLALTIEPGLYVVSPFGTTDTKF